MNNLKTLRIYNDRIANLYAESGDYKYAKELRADTGKSKRCDSGYEKIQQRAAA